MTLTTPMHLLMGCQWSALLTNNWRSGLRKNFSAWTESYMVRGLFSKPLSCMGGEKWPIPLPTKAFLKLSPYMTMLFVSFGCILRVYPPSSSCPTLSAHAEVGTFPEVTSQVSNLSGCSCRMYYVYVEDVAWVHSK